MCSFERYLSQREEPFRSSLHMRFAHAPMVAQYGSDAVVDAALKWRSRSPVAVLKIGEQHPFPVQRVEQVPCFAESVMRVPRTAISIPGAFFGEVSVGSPPNIEELLPLDRFLDCGGFGEGSPDLGEMLTGQGSRAQREVSAEVHTNMEDAALDSSVGPLLPEG